MHACPAVDSKEDCSFLKKRTKRLLLLRRSPRAGHFPNLDVSAGTKVFWFFSSEKNILPS
jgi:hypothetical protein